VPKHRDGVVQPSIRPSIFNELLNISIRHLEIVEKWTITLTGSTSTAYL